MQRRFFSGQKLISSFDYSFRNWKFFGICCFQILYTWYFPLLCLLFGFCFITFFLSLVLLLPRLIFYDSIHSIFDTQSSLLWRTRWLYGIYIYFDVVRIKFVFWGDQKIWLCNSREMFSNIWKTIFFKELYI